MLAKARGRRCAAFAAALLLGAHPAPVSGADPASAADLCVVRVEDTAAAGSIEAEQSWRYLWSAYVFPGSPIVVLNPQRTGVWTLSDDRRFVRMSEDALPRDSYGATGRWNIDSVVEAHSGRVLGVSSGRGLWTLAPGAERFAAHWPGQWPELGALRARTIAHVPAWRATVFGGLNGLFVARDDDPIAPVPGPDSRPLGDVTRAVAVPGRGAAVVGTINGGVWLVTGELGATRARWLFSYPPITEPGRGRFAQGQGSDSVAEVLPLPGPGMFLIRGGRHAHVLTLPSSGGAAGEATIEEVERAPSGPPFNEYRKLAPGTGECLVYVPVAQRERLPSRAGLFRLEGTRFVPVPGGDAAALGREARFFAVPSRGLVVRLARPHDRRLFAYRDGALAPVPDSNGAGPTGWVHDLPAVRRVVVRSHRGVFELTQDLRLVPILAPVPLSWIAAVAEMSPLGVAAVIAHEGVFTLGPEGGLAPVPGGEAAGSLVARHVFLPSRNELLYTGHEGLFLLVDRRLSGPDACAPPAPGAR